MRALGELRPQRGEGRRLDERNIGVGDENIVGERAETVREARRHEQLVAGVVGELDSQVLAEIPRRAAQVDDHVENFSAQHPDQLRLREGGER